MQIGVCVCVCVCVHTHKVYSMRCMPWGAEIDPRVLIIDDHAVLMIHAVMHKTFSEKCYCSLLH